MRIVFVVLPNAFSDLAQFMVSVNRITDFLLSKELETSPHGASRTCGKIEVEGTQFHLICINLERWLL